MSVFGILPDTEKILTTFYVECILNNEEKEKIENAIKIIRNVVLDEPIVEQSELNYEALPIDISTLKWNQKMGYKIKQWVNASLRIIRNERKLENASDK